MISRFLRIFSFFCHFPQIGKIAEFNTRETSQNKVLWPVESRRRELKLRRGRATALFSQITRSYFCVSFTYALSVLSESLEEATENATYRTSCSVFFAFPPQPYVNIHGQLVRPPSRESDEFLRPDSLRSSRDALTPEPEMPVRPRQPRGSGLDDRGEPEINYFSYLV